MKVEGKIEDNGEMMDRGRHMGVLCPALGGDADLCRLPDRMDPVCGGVRGVGVRRAGLCAYPGVSHSDIAGQVRGHVQPHHLPGGGLEEILHKFRLLQSPAGTHAFQKVKVKQSELFILLLDISSHIFFMYLQFVSVK